MSLTSHFGKVRLSSGRLKGRVLPVPAEGVRPTPGRVREALLTSLACQLPGAIFLDLFAGSGAVGLEAYSRGCERVVLVERDAAVAASLRQSLRSLGLASGGAVRLLAVDAERALRVLTDAGERFNLIFMDPPYELWHELSPLVAFLAPLLVSGGQVIAQRDRKQPIPELDGLTLTRTRQYGRTGLDFFSDRDIF